MEMQLIKAIQSLSNEIMDNIMYGFTILGESIFFLLVFFIIYWCYNKEFAFKYTLVYLFSVGINQLFKNIIRRPRPYTANSTINNIHTQMGYSFPSGHTQAYFVQFGLIATEMKKKNIKKLVYNFTIVSLTIMGVMLMVSRQYLGQHYLTDTICASVLGIVIAIVCQSIHIKNSILRKCLNYRYLSIVFSLVSVLLYLGIVFLGFFKNSTSLGMVTMFSGAILGISIGYILDYYFIKYDPKDVLCSSVFKAIIGMMMVLLAFLVCNRLYQFNVYSQYVLYLVVSLVGVVIVPIILKMIFSKPVKSMEISENE